MAQAGTFHSQQWFRPPVTSGWVGSPVTSGWVGSQLVLGL